jgi:hypothetical protein
MLLTLGLTACSQTPPPGVPQASQLTPGVTTYQQVIAALGTPTSDVLCFVRKVCRACHKDLPQIRQEIFPV